MTNTCMYVLHLSLVIHLDGLGWRHPDDIHCVAAEEALPALLAQHPAEHADHTGLAGGPHHQMSADGLQRGNNCGEEPRENQQRREYA